MLRGNQQRNASGVPQSESRLDIGRVEHFFDGHDVRLLARKNLGQILMDFEKAFMKRLAGLSFDGAEYEWPCAGIHRFR